jgi:hypothetical protein
MPQTTVADRFAIQKLLPLYCPEDAIELPINLAPGSTFTQGTVLGRIGTTSANDLQTLTVTGTPTGGTIALTGTNPFTGAAFTTAAIAYNAAASAVATAVSNALGITGATVTGGGGALPGPAVTLTFSGALAGMPVPLLALGTNALTGGTTPTAAVVHTTIGRSLDTYAAYNDGASDGTQTAKCILPYACATDTAGNITLGTSATGGFYGETMSSIGAYFAGYFDTSQLTGLDANGVTDLGRLISGTVTAGVLAVTGP